MLKAVLSRNRGAVKFGLAFVGYLTALALVFESFDNAFARFYLKPTSTVTSFLLEYLGVEAQLNFANLSQGFCDISLDSVTYRITHSCTGVFTGLIFMAGVLAYPSAIGPKLRGLVLGLLAFFIFGTARLVFMGVIAAAAPAYISLFHRYIMVMVGVGFALFLWMWWVDRVVGYEAGRSLSA